MKISGGILVKHSFPSAIVRFDKIKEMIKLQKNDLMLDVGCGIGALSSELSKNCYFIVGLEYNKKSVSIGTRYFKRKNFKFVIGDGQRLPFKKIVFDKILCTEIIEHVPNYYSLIHEINRVLKVGGNLVLTTPNRDIGFPSVGFIPVPNFVWILGKITRDKHFLYPYGHEFGIFSISKIRKLFNKFNLKINNFEYLGFVFVKFFDDLAYTLSVVNHTIGEVGWFNKFESKFLNFYNKIILPLVKLLIKIDEKLLKTKLEGYIIFVDAIKIE